jgi:hypothetical protein
MRSDEKRCTECGAVFDTNKFYGQTGKSRQAQAVTCSDGCARERKTRLQKRRRQGGAR